MSESTTEDSATSMQKMTTVPVLPGNDFVLAGCKEYIHWCLVAVVLSHWRKSFKMMKREYTLLGRVSKCCFIIFSMCIILYWVPKSCHLVG